MRRRAALGIGIFFLLALPPAARGELLQDVPNARAALGLRRLSSAYAGPLVKVRRAADNAILDIGMDASGNLDVGALESFASGGDVAVEVWYDQTGGGTHLTQANASAQPQIVSAGSVITDEDGQPRLFFNGGALIGRNGPLISNQNLTAFFVQQWSEGSDHKGLLALGKEKLYNHLQWFVSGFLGYIGDGGSWTGLEKGTAYTSNTATLKTVQIFDANGQNVRFFRNSSLVRDLTHDKGASEQSDFQVGSYAGYISEILLYPHLSDTQRETVFANINAYYETGAVDSTDVNEGALLPQDWRWQVDLYDWLETITIPQVTTRFNQSPRPLSWDGTFSGTEEELASLAIHMGAGQSYDSHIMTADPKWYVLDDGNGAGIEGSGELRLYHGQAAVGGLWYSQDLTNADGAQGNPYYQDDALGLRVLITAAVTLMRHIEQQEGSSYWSQVDFVGGMLNGVVAPYAKFRHLLDEKTQAAFEEAFVYEAQRILSAGPHGINSNMDTKAIAALAHVYQVVDDPGSKDVILRAVRKILFGSETGTPETTNAEGVGGSHGIYNGYSIVEGASPETTYNGVSLYYLSEAHSVTRGDPDWAFMDTVVSSLAEFMIYQIFRDPNNFWDGPSGYAGRTGGSFVHGDQRDESWRDLYPAATLAGTEALAWEVKYGGQPRISLTKDGLLGSIKNAVNWTNGHGPVKDHSGETPPKIPANLHWPEDNVYLPAAGWYDKIKTLLQNTANPRELYPFEGQEHFSKLFKQDFWAYKNSDASGNDFGFFVQAIDWPGHYGGWYGIGALETFWTRETGMLILARHDKSGGDWPQENTRIYFAPGTGENIIDLWATNHVWGLDENGRAFTTATATDRKQRTVRYMDISGASPAVESEVELGWVSAKGQQTGQELTGRTVVKSRVQALSDGVQVTHAVASDGADGITQLWATIPVFLRNAQTSIPDTTIERFDGEAWTAMTTSTVTTTKIRLGRDFNDGRGPRYGYIRFASAQNVRLSARTYEQSYQGRSLVRNIHVDLSGGGATMPLSASVAYSILTHDPPQPANAAPSVDAGADLTLAGSPATARMKGSVSDDGLPGPGALTAAWSQVSGPGAVAFDDAAQAGPAAVFSGTGTYVLRLTADDGDLQASDDVTVEVLPPSSCPTFVRLTLHPSKPDKAYLAVRSDCPEFTGASLSASVGLPSGGRSATLARHPRQPAVYYAELPSKTLSPADLLDLGGRHVAVDLAGTKISGVGEGNRLTPELGGRIVESLAGGAEAILRPGDFAAEATLDIRPAPAADAERRRQALSRQSLKSLGAGREFAWSSSGQPARATVSLPFDRALLPPELGEGQIRVAYFNPATGSWELQDKAEVAGGSVRADVTHFSVYQPVAVLPSAVPNLQEAYVFPNPAAAPHNPTIRVFLGVVDRVEITIFDISGRRVHSASVSGPPTGIIGSAYHYDYTWDGEKASGVYFAVIHGRSAGQTIRARAKFAVVR